MKTATITFHGSHNYGSMLQAYALQQKVQELVGHNEIINFRSDAQQRMNRVITGRKRIATVLKDLTHLFYYTSLQGKHQKFESFLKDYLICTKEYHSLEELNEVSLDYDVFISGSDQIWNPNPEDFSLAYLLPFVHKAKKISYAASLGPRSKFKASLSGEYASLLKSYQAISVREEGSKQTIQELLPNRSISIVNDPVFLLCKEQWEKLIDKEPIVKGNYLFFYTLFADAEMIRIVNEYSKRMQIPVIISNFTNFYDLTSGFKKKLDCGPLEFLNLIYHARFICTSSFHGTALSMLLNKEFMTIRGMHDNRISSILNMMKLSERSIDNHVEVLDKIQLNEIDYHSVNQMIESYREVGVHFLKENLL